MSDLAQVLNTNLGLCNQIQVILPKKKGEVYLPRQFGMPLMPNTLRVNHILVMFDSRKLINLPLSVSFKQAWYSVTTECKIEHSRKNNLYIRTM